MIFTSISLLLLLVLGHSGRMRSLRQYVSRYIMRSKLFDSDAIFFSQMVNGTFVVACPQNSQAQSALSSLDCICELFKTTEHLTVHTSQSQVRLHDSLSFFLFSLLPYPKHPPRLLQKILLRLREEAHQAWSERRSASSQVVEMLGFWTNIPNPYGPATIVTPPPQ